MIPKVTEGQPIPKGLSYKTFKDTVRGYVRLGDHIGRVSLSSEFPWVSLGYVEIEPKGPDEASK